MSSPDLQRKCWLHPGSLCNGYSCGGQKDEEDIQPLACTACLHGELNKTQSLSSCVMGNFLGPLRRFGSSRTHGGNWYFIARLASTETAHHSNHYQEQHFSRAAFQTTLCSHRSCPRPAMFTVTCAWPSSVNINKLNRQEHCLWLRICRSREWRTSRTCVQEQSSALGAAWHD